MVGGVQLASSTAMTKPSQVAFAYEAAEAWWADMLGLDVEQVIGEASGLTLAEIMTELHVQPHRGEQGSKALAPKGWT